MLETITDIRLPTPQRYAVRVGRHFEHRVSVHREDALVRIHFPDATCDMRPSVDFLHVHIQSRSPESLSRCRDVVARHLRQVASRETFSIAWSGDFAGLP